jgi:hypothetical protein
LAVVLLAGCHVPAERVSARAEDVWTRSYPLAEGGQFEVVNARGGIEIAGGPGETVEVRAERTARATSEAAARDLLPNIEIRAEATPARVFVRTEGVQGLLVGADYEVMYRVKVPAYAIVRARTANGDIAVSGVSGRVVASTANGDV